jgi:hydrogenase-4 component B
VQSRGRSQVETVTWDCGYAAASPRIQYTASSFAESLVGILSGVLRPRVHAPTISGLFPAPSRMETHVDDAVLEDAVRPAFLRAGALLARVHAVQGGRVQVYVLYVALATLALLLAALPVGPALRALWNG